ncbi:MAG: DUF4388 domain-containing protein, partial [Thermoanaerobaculia bacterium]
IASSAARETLGSLLLCRQLIDEEGLAQALETQHQASEEKRLGTILVETGLLSEEALRRVITRQTEGVISEFMEWDGGYFKFDLLHLPDQGEIEVDAQDFVHPDGLSAQQILMHISDEMDRTAVYPLPSEAAESGSEPSSEPPAGRPSGLDSLKTIMGVIRSPEFTGEATGQILGFAREQLPRGALFVVRRDGFRAMSLFGAGGKSATASANRLRLPLDQPSVVAEAADRQESYRGPLESNKANRTLVAALGDETPTEVVAIPLVVNDLVLLVLYGDNGGTDEPIGQVDQLELLMLQAGLAMERHLLRKRLESLEDRQSR